VSGTNGSRGIRSSENFRETASESNGDESVSKHLNEICETIVNDGFISTVSGL